MTKIAIKFGHCYYESVKDLSLETVMSQNY